jgi:hypothetical protein
MPISNPWHLPVVLHYATSVKPARILDIGVGMGAYGFMLRQYLDVANERIKPESWETVIDGVEIFPEYGNPVWEYAYDTIHIGDVRQLLSSLGKYDLIIANDVLEHFSQHEARMLAQEFLRMAPVLIATTPAGEYPQGAWGGNEAETHHCTLEPSDFPNLQATHNVGATNVFVCVTDRGPLATIKNAILTCPSINPSKLKNFIARVKRKLGL